MRFVIITGLSGAGKSQAMNLMEDLGFYCIDNMPPAFIPKFAEVCFQSQGKMEKVALVMDIRGGELFNDLFDGLDSLKKAGYSYEILFLEASEQVLVKRFKETRRKHPLASDGRILEAIEEEKNLLQNVRDVADHIIDTSNLQTRQLKEQLLDIFIQGKKYRGIIVSILSFGFKYGIPLDSDIVFDVRFIPNPFYISNLRAHNGLKQDVKDYVLKWPEANEFLTKLEDMLEFLIPNYIKEGKSQLVLSIGCTGGKHRSVTIAEELNKFLMEHDYSTVVEHRDIEKDVRSH